MLPFSMKDQQRGFTLIELMFTIVVMAVLLSIGVPSFRDFIRSSRMAEGTNALVGDLNFARSEAIKRNQNTTVVPLGGSWANGWEVRDAGGQALRARQALGASLAVNSATAGVTFRPNGRLTDNLTETQLTWSISSSVEGVTPRCVVVSTTGAARSRTGAC